MEGKQVLKSIRLRNVLSFGDQGQSLDLEPLNVLIGANGSGKSNLLEIFGLLRALPGDLSVPFRNGGGIAEWLWKGRSEAEFFEVETTWDYALDTAPLRHRIVLAVESLRPKVVEEVIDQGTKDEAGYVRHYFYSSLDPSKYGGPDYFDHVDRLKVGAQKSGFRTDASILAQRWDAAQRPGMAFLAEQYAAIRLYRSWTFGPKSSVRAPQRADLPGDYLLEDATNLGLILNTLLLDRGTRSTVLDNLKAIYEGVRDVRIKIVSGYVELHLVEEEEERLVPGVRLSDGTLRYLSLLALLCHPEPPPLLCIEEPELGLHPDLVRGVTRLLLCAAERTQLVITTHSVGLVDSLIDIPESVVVCGRGVNGTELQRLDAKRLEKWLEEYSLGELWEMGEIGGNRW